MNQAILGFVLTGAAYVVGCLVFFIFSRSRGFNRHDAGWLLAAGLCGGITGAKATRLLMGYLSGASPELLLAHPDGRTIIGGVLFGWLAIEFAKDRLKITRSTGDGFALALAAGEAIGRVGCFFNGCCYGAACSVPWAVYQAGAWRHPAQLYSAAAASAIFTFLCLLRKRVRYEGDLFRIYLVLFGASRFALEFYRERTGVYFGLSIAQWMSLEIAIAMIVAIVWSYRSQQKVKGAVAVDELNTV